MRAATARAALPRPESRPIAATELPIPRRTAISTPRKATPSSARQAVKATPATPASAANRASGPSMANRVAAEIAASVPVRKARSEDMAAHGTRRSARQMRSRRRLASIAAARYDPRTSRLEQPDVEAPVERFLMYLRIFPGTEAEYDRRHAEIWPELVTEIQESGIRNFTGFRRGTDVWYYAECHPDAATAFGIHGPKPHNQRWNHYFRDVIAE